MRPPLFCFVDSIWRGAEISNKGVYTGLVYTYTWVPFCVPSVGQTKLMYRYTEARFWGNLLRFETELYFGVAPYECCLMILGEPG